MAISANDIPWRLGSQAGPAGWRRLCPRPESFVIVSLALLVIGLLAVMSATAPLDRSTFDVPLWRSTFGRQLIFAGVSLIVFAISVRVAPVLFDRPRARWWLVAGGLGLVLGALALALIPGLVEERRGSQRWFSLGWGGIGFQPSEFAKPALILFLAAWLGREGARPGSFRWGFLPSIAVIGLCGALVGVEDFGTAALICAAGVLTLFAAGCRIGHLALAGLAGACGFAVLLRAATYRMNRLTSFWEIWDQSLGGSYQPVQSLIAIYSGGWYGTGLGSGIAKHGYLPDGHTDFIFALICEEAGVLGGGLLIVLFALFAWLGFATALSARSSFERLAAFGLTCLIGCQAAMNIAVVTVVAPTTGIPLPFVSAGGSGLLATWFSVGLLVAIAQRAGGEADRSDGTLEGSRPW